ncbi:MAG TPA: hypothetical protein VGP68_06900 [Gemmataceae bacterium]|jgi:hypothetical protein|nr:hypothetical protein [Gemmataceae bacterium]
MQFQFDMSGPNMLPPQPPADSANLAGILQQMLEVQRQQLTHLQTLVSAHDGAARWRAFLARWREDFPELAEACRQAIPTLERTYSKLITELTDQLGQNGAEALESEFVLQEFLDRYGMRLTQLGTLLNMVAPLADASSPSEST